ncbi:hypothetical protein FHG87_021403 [Trinorchestia longiramus]|nr:hypothetical protein FHG87_021403 [Trinorchestia longiramus]
MKKHSIAFVIYFISASPSLTALPASSTSSQMRAATVWSPPCSQHLPPFHSTPSSRSKRPSVREPRASSMMDSTTLASLVDPAVVDKDSVDPAVARPEDTAVANLQDLVVVSHLDLVEAKVDSAKVDSEEAKEVAAMRNFYSWT